MRSQTTIAEVMRNPMHPSRIPPSEADSALGRIEKIRLGSDPDLSYYYFRSSRPRSELPLFVAVHGIQRRAADQARLFAPLIDALGGVLLAPVFGRKHFKGYQRLGQSRNGRRSDLAFQRMLADIYRLEGRHFSQMVMFGYSGGGQFIHRYAMSYPRQVKRMAIAAPGWFTFPDLGVPFPYGLKPTATLPDLRFDAARFLKIPALVLVGQEDTFRDRSLNQRDRIDHRQGLNRMERAQKWIDAMTNAASRFGYATPYQFSTVPHCGHSFIDCMTRGKMGREVVRFLFEDIRDPAVQKQKKAIPSYQLPGAGGGGL